MIRLDPQILRLAVALGIGLLIGTERERRKSEDAARHPAGIRTFALASMTGAVSFIAGDVLLLGIAISGIFGLTALAHWREKIAPGLTTEIALIAATLLGGLAMTQPALAAGIAVVVTIVLGSRPELHHFVRSSLNTEEVRDGLIFAAATLIVLPLLPDEQLGPYQALNPHAIWLLVILVMLIGAFGHVAVRFLGPRFGLPLAGLASGFISSAATIGAMGARVWAAPALMAPAAAGAILSTVATVIEMGLLLAATNVATFRGFLHSLLYAGAASVLYGLVFALWAMKDSAGEASAKGRAFSLWSACQFAALLSVVLVASKALNEWFGATGAAAAAAVAGFADTHSAAISIAALVGAGQLRAEDAALPILFALSTNTFTKLVFSAAGGAGFALRVAPGLILVLAAAWAGQFLPISKLIRFE